MKETERYNVDRDSFYDFNCERLSIMVLSGYMVIEKPVLYGILTMLHLTCVFCVHSFHIVLAIYTIMRFSGEKGIVISCCVLLILLIFTITLIVIRRYTSASLDVVRKHLREGIFRYEVENLSEEYCAIKKKRVVQIKLLISYFTKYCYFSALSNIIFVPLLQFLTVEGDTADLQINPFLPLPIYMPFSTRTYTGYCLAFFLQSTFLILSFSAYICHEELYLSIALQLCVQLEILNFSIRDLEKRAYNKLKERNLHRKGEDPLYTTYDSRDLQACLYECLRENILHYQAIIRFQKAIAPYLETTNFFVVLGFSLLLATELLVVMENPSLNMAVILTLFSDFFGLLQMMYVGQMVVDESEQTALMLYSTPWIFSDKKFKTLLNMTITKTQKPLYLRFKFFRLRASLATFADIVLAGYKIVNVIR